jgi:hypothetical protein
MAAILDYMITTMCIFIVLLECKLEGGVDSEIGKLRVVGVFF